MKKFLLKLFKKLDRKYVEENSDYYKNEIDQLISEKQKFALTIFSLENYDLIEKIYSRDLAEQNRNDMIFLIRRFFPNSALFKINVDEYLLIHKDHAYTRKDERLASLDRKIEENNKDSQGLWERYALEYETSDYDPEIDKCTSNIILRTKNRLNQKKREKGSTVNFP